MKLKFIKESIIIDEKNSNADDQPSKKALKGFRLNILDYIKREFVNTVKKKGLLCVLDEKSNPMTLKIQRPKNMDILKPETIKVTDDMLKMDAGNAANAIIKDIKGRAKDSLEKLLNKTNFNFSEAIINEGPVADLFAKMATKMQLKKEKGVEKNNRDTTIKKLVETINARGASIPIEMETTQVVVYIKIAAEYDKTDIKISCRSVENLTILEAEIEESEDSRSYYISKVEDFFGNRMDNLNSDLPIEDALQRIAEKIDVQIPEPKFNTVTGRSGENTLQKRIKDDKILINLYNNDYIDANKSREIVKLLSNIKEDLNDPNDFAAYKKALSMATDKNGKHSPYIIGLILQYMIKKEFQNCAKELSDTNTLRKFQKFMEKHLELDDIRDKLVALKKDGDLKKFFGHKLEIAPLANCKVATDANYYEVGDSIELTITPDKGFVFEKAPTIKNTVGIKILSVDKDDENNSYNITFIVQQVLEDALEILGKLVEKKDVKDEAPKEKKTPAKTPIEKDYNKMLKDIKSLGLRIDTTKLFTRDEEGNINGVTPLFNQLKKILKG